MQLFCTLQQLISWECVKKKKHTASPLPLIVDTELQSQAKLHVPIHGRHKGLTVLI